MQSVERVTLFGDIKGIDTQYIRQFMDITGSSYGGSFPDREKDLREEEMVVKTRQLLSEAGILNADPIILCNSTEERAVRILQACNLCNRQNGIGFYWVIDRNPDTLLAAVKSVINDQTPRDVLSSITLVLSAPKNNFDFRDSSTGIRVVALPVTPRFPTHPTPAS